MREGLQMKTNMTTTVRYPDGTVRAILTRAAAATSEDVIRTTVQLPAELHTALRRRAVNEDTTMGDLVRTALHTGLQAPAELAAESMPYRRTKVGSRTTVDLPRGLHRTLKVVAIEHDTTVQSLILAAVLRAGI